MSTIKPFKISIIRCYCKELRGWEEVAKSFVEFFQNEDQARYRAIEEASKIFLLMRDIHRFKGFSGVRWIITQMGNNA